jgi:hypothetical protein
VSRKTLLDYGARVLNALAATILIVAGVHLGVALISFLVTRQIDYVNPIDFLGFSLVWPKYLHSETATLIAWLFLLLAFAFVFIVHGRLRISVAITRKPKQAIAAAEKAVATKLPKNK